MHMRSGFPALISYTRFVELVPSALPAMCLYLRVRIGRHRVFAEVAKRGKNSMGWFYGFKLYLIVNDQGELLTVQLSPGNSDDRKPVPQMTKTLWGKLVGDRGHLPQALFGQLFVQRLQSMAAGRPLPITPIGKNMQSRHVVLEDKLLTRKRFVIGTIVDQLKNISQIEHTRHPSTTNIIVNLIAGLIANTGQANKPSLHLSDKDMALLPALT